MAEANEQHLGGENQESPTQPAESDRLLHRRRPSALEPTWPTRTWRVDSDMEMAEPPVTPRISPVWLRDTVEETMRARMATAAIVPHDRIVMAWNPQAHGEDQVRFMMNERDRSYARVRANISNLDRLYVHQPFPGISEEEAMKKRRQKWEEERTVHSMSVAAVEGVDYRVEEVAELPCGGDYDTNDPSYVAAAELRDGLEMLKRFDELYDSMTLYARMKNELDPTLVKKPDDDGCRSAPLNVDLASPAPVSLVRQHGGDNAERSSPFSPSKVWEQYSPTSSYGMSPATRWEAIRERLYPTKASLEGSKAASEGSKAFTRGSEASPRSSKLPGPSPLKNVSLAYEEDGGQEHRVSPGVSPANPVNSSRFAFLGKPPVFKGDNAGKELFPEKLAARKQATHDSEPSQAASSVSEYDQIREKLFSTVAAAIKRRGGAPATGSNAVPLGCNDRLRERRDDSDAAQEPSLHEGNLSGRMAHVNRRGGAGELDFSPPELNCQPQIHRPVSPDSISMSSLILDEKIVASLNPSKLAMHRPLVQASAPSQDKTPALEYKRGVKSLMVTPTKESAFPMDMDLDMPLTLKRKYPALVPMRAGDGCERGRQAEYNRGEGEPFMTPKRVISTPMDSDMTKPSALRRKYPALSPIRAGDAPQRGGQHGSPSMRMGSNRRGPLDVEMTGDLSSSSPPPPKGLGRGEFGKRSSHHSGRNSRRESDRFRRDSQGFRRQSVDNRRQTSSSRPRESHRLDETSFRSEERRLYIEERYYDEGGLGEPRPAYDERRSDNEGRFGNEGLFTDNVDPRRGRRTE